VLGLGVLDLSDDEAFFVQIAHNGTYVQLAGSDEPHPPLYLAMLQGWMAPAGVTEYAVRFLSVLFGVALVAGMYQLGRRLAGEWLGLAAAAVAALNPYQIFYSQTARNYEQACLFGLISFVLLLGALHRPRLLPAYAAAALLAMFSHYYAIAVVLFGQMVLFGWLWRRRFKGWPRWVAADAAIAAVFLPWAAYSLRTVANYEPGHGTPDIAAGGLLQAWQFYNFGTAFRPGDVVWPSVGAGALLALGVMGLRREGALGISLGYQVAPLLFGLATLVHTTQFGARFLFLGSPGYLLVVAGAIVYLARRPALTLAPLAAIGAMAGFAIHNTIFSGQFTDKAYSRLAAYLARHVMPGETVVLDGISQHIQYWYYAQLREGISQPAAIMPLKADGGGADGAPVDLAQTEKGLANVVRNSTGIWLIDDDSLRYDPNLDTQRILAREHFRASSRAFRGQRLDYYAVAEPGPLRDIAHRLDGVTLAQASRLDSAVPAGRAVPLRVIWKAEHNNPAAFKVSLRLIDRSGEIVSQDDSPAGAGFWEAAWRAGSAREDRRALLVPVGLVPGAYRLQLVAYEADSGRPLGPPVDLQEVRVDHSAPQRPEASGMPAIGALVGAEQLAGADVPAEIPAGEKLGLTLLWTGGPAMDPESAPVSLGPVQVAHQIGGGSYPTTEWQPADVVRDRLTIRVPPGLAPGTYPLLVGDVRLANVRVLPTKRQFAPPALGRPLSARFGEVAQLLGYDVEPAEPGLRVRMVWKALSETPVSYSVFVHALGDDGRIRAQVDVMAGTDNWVPGEFVTATYDLPSAGDAKLAIGLYDPRTGARLPVCPGSSGCAAPADHVELSL